MATTPLTGSRYPASSGAFVPDQDLHNALLDIESQVIPRFATTGVRDSAYSAWATATGKTLSESMYCAVTATGALYRYDGTRSAWVISGGKPVYSSLTINGGWTAVTGHATRVRFVGDGCAMLSGWFSNGGSFVVNGTQIPVTLPAAYWPAADRVIKLAAAGFNTPILSTVLASTGQIRMDNGGTGTYPAGTNFFLDDILIDVVYTG